MDEIESLPMPAGVASLAMESLGGLSLPRDSGTEGVLELAGRWGLEEDGASRQIQGLFWYYLAQDVADKGGFGLWRDIYRQFQEMEDAGVAGASLDGTL